MPGMFNREDLHKCSNHTRLTRHGRTNTGRVVFILADKTISPLHLRVKREIRREMDLVLAPGGENPVHYLKPRQKTCALDCFRADRIAKLRHLTKADEIVFRELLFRWMNRETGDCWPSLQTIADAAGLCRRTVCSSIQRLRKAGWLKWCRRRMKLKGGRWTQAPNDYLLKLPRRWIRTVRECKPCARTTGIFVKVGAGHLMRVKKAVVQAVKAEPAEPLPPNFGSNSEILANIDDPDLRETARRCLLIASRGSA
jgi:hypothetical protein